MKQMESMKLALGTACCIMAAVCSGDETVFRDDFEGARKPGWTTSSKRFSYAPGEGVGGSQALVWDGPGPVESRELYSYTFPAECGRSYSYTIKARSAEDIVGRVYVRIAGVKANGRRAFTLNGMPIINNHWRRGRKWTEITGCTPPMPPDIKNGIVEVSLLDRTTGKVYFDDLVVTAGGRTIIRYLQSSAYRDEAVDGTVKFAAYYGIDPVQHPLASRRAFFVYKGVDGKERRIKAQEQGEMFFTATIPVSDMAEGRNPVKAILTDAAGTELDLASLPFTRVSTLPPRRVRFDEHQRLIVDCKLFFPLGCYGGGIDDAKADLYASFPFNCTLVSNPEAVERARKRGLKVIFGTGSSAESVKRAISKWRNDPTIIAWYTADEIPIGFAKRQEKVRELAHAADPDRPAFTVLDKPMDTRDLLATFDVIGTDPYPICNPRPIDICTGWPLTTRKMTFGMRPIWQVPQAFDWHWHRRNFRHGMDQHHFPTREEFMSMAWQPLAVGVKGLIWYSFNWFIKDIPQDEYEATLAYFRQTVTDIARYTDVFLSVEPIEPPTTSAKGVTVRSWRLGEKRYLLAVNTKTSPVRAEVSAGEVKDVHVEVGEKASVADGRLVFDLPSLGFSFVRY